MSRRSYREECAVSLDPSITVGLSVTTATGRRRRRHKPGGSRERKLPAWDPGHSVCAARAYRSRASRRLRCRRRRRRRNAHFYKVRSLGNSVEEERPRAGRHSAGGLLPRVCPLAGTRRVYPFFYSELRGARACARSSRVLVNKWGVLFGNEKPPLGESEFWF